MALSKADLAELTRNLPHQPGVYLMENSRAKVIYVGKAKDLKKRVLSYFQEGRAATADPKTAALVRNAAKVDFLVVGTEKEALILEATLIKRHRPRYNINLRDDKAYPFIRLSMGWEYPQLAIVRRMAKDRHRYFGPYVSVGAARSTMKLMNRLFPIRKCKGPTPEDRSRPCLHHQMGQCPAPCCFEIDTEEYRRWVDQAAQFLSGRLKEVSDKLETEMWRASEEEKFEAAAGYRDKLAAVKRTLEKQVMVSSQDIDRDVFGFAGGPTGQAVVVLFVRSGALVGSRSFFLKGIREVDGRLVAQAVSQFYTGKQALPDQILLPRQSDDQELLAEWLSEAAGRKVRIVVPQRGQGRALIGRASANAESALPVLAGSPEALASQGAEELAKKLGLTRPPESMECYDISILQGGDPVGAMVRFEDGRPARSKYRNYKIRSVAGQDDFAMLAEVLKRRFTGTSTMEPPDLIVMDGGKGQLSAAEAVLAEIGRGEQPLAALAKTPGEVDQDRLFIPGRKNHVPLSRAARFLLMRLRDETHRRAITAHRKRRSKKIRGSKLLEIPGVGEARAKALLKHLGSLKAVRAAGVEELARVPGISPGLAETIKAALEVN